ncbi:MAG: hypothetical protein N3F66_06855 [Spirochaetes bacterium]|nr:hypothetical protein [Spirochaetota bacterium]
MYCKILCVLIAIGFYTGAFADTPISITPTPLVYKYRSTYMQRFIIESHQEYDGEIVITIDGNVTKTKITQKTKFIAVDCKRDLVGSFSNVKLVLRKNGVIAAQHSITIPPVKNWKIYCVPFAHIDIGFTQSQKNIQKQNLQNVETHLELCKKTQRYPQNSQFKLFTEVSWPVIEYLNAKEIPQERKNALIVQLKKGNFELGAFVISHQNRFMSPYALLASLQHTLKIAHAHSIPVKTACIHDVMDFSKLPKVLYANNIPYCMIGPNDSRYKVPPLFYLASPDKSAKILVWHTVGLNGYGENFDLNMRLTLPFNDEKFTLMENSIARHLAQLEKGYPTEEILRYYDYNQAHWNYPYDAYLLPYYPSEGGDNQPQTITPSEIAKRWNEKFINPKIIIATPKEFFEYVAEKYTGQIPLLQGELPPFWGEQIYLDFIQVDPERLSINYWYDTEVFMRGVDMVQLILRGNPVESSKHIDQILDGYMAIILNNDHNPRPVPFGKTHYTSQDVKDWMHTRNRWVYTPLGTLKDAKYPEHSHKAQGEWTLLPVHTNPVTLDNAFYRILFDTSKGCIVSIFDKQLQKEWVNAKHQYGFNQYVIGVRGENVAQRNYFETIQGFKKVTSTLYTNSNNDYRIVVEGSERSYYKGMDVLSQFLHNAFGVKLPPFLLKIAYFFYQLFTPSLSLTQEIIIPAQQKRIDFVQHFTGTAPQIAEHYISYPVAAEELLYDSAFSVVKWGSNETESTLIPAVKNVAPFRSINDTLFPFQWMHGVPSSFHCDGFVMHKDRLHYAVFIPHNSKAIVPDKNSNAFYHCCIGWSLWGTVGLGRNLPETIAFKSTFTSFTAKTKNEAIATAYNFSFDQLGFNRPVTFETHNANVRVIYNQPVARNKVVIGVFELSGTTQTAQLRVNTKRALHAYYSDINGKKIKPAKLFNTSISVRLNPHQLSFITLELL